ncbi:replication restart helicase PriA [Desulforamulus hydrothermalis]|uniref:Replication restart protein PriA n=1 Tax=Desulforamulus hydrothermalis Lam5 = DSM 18033 TaxID=1121428 RepID=K8DX87_9FIRM|nr:primosomal protein N' [Desulforamulus hydrothermalis]CCO07187.1 Primosomal protein N' [Desulforamulus hydrothermalis Lam5 = DSM 18033]SHG88243.1 replication restart DNA helicase PriA [Desulforamulus hydrothermalis Lam5 = DSM 18033]
MQYAEVAVIVPVRLYQTFHYRVPSQLQSELKKFSRVEVPFAGRLVQGFVVGFSRPPHLQKVKDIKRVLEQAPFLNDDLYETACWMVQRYLCSLGDALQCIAGSPVGSSQARQENGLVVADGQFNQAVLARAPKQKITLEAARACPGLTKSQLAAKAGVSAAVVNALLAKGLLKEAAAVQAGGHEAMPRAAIPPLTAEQELAVSQLRQALRAAGPSAWLLHGVTGSGKTEVYLRLIDETLNMRRQVIVLVPEISLTPQMVERFRARFGQQVALLHSALSQGERYAEKARIRAGQAAVVLGARSAIFAPVPDLGLIIIDEEHEHSYKQEESPKYHAREVALQRAAQNKAVVVLGSATPALESYCRARPGGPYGLITMTKRVDQRELPKVHIIDLRKELAAGNTSIFSVALQNALAGRLAKGEKSILFLNRRGLATVVICRQCGGVMKCPRCEISYTLHSDGWLKCHYCGHAARAPGICPCCGGQTIRSFGVGTQRVEEEVKRLFPDCRVLRMDADTTARKGSHRQLLHEFAHGDAQVLIGTQMIAKGLDIHQVTLVGVISADITLHMPDFRAAERTFQLLTQVAGRAGRGSKPGEVIIQTYDPGHFSIITAQNHDYLGFYHKEMAVRRSLRYPPFSYLIKILFTGLNEGDVMAAAQYWQERLAEAGRNLAVRDWEILGPAPAGIPRIKNRYRWQLILKGMASRDIRRLAAAVLEQAGTRYKQVAVSIDVDPLNL